MNYQTFLAYARRAPFGNRLSPQQAEGLTKILDYWTLKYSGRDIRWLAYVLATVFHETGSKMQPIREANASTDKQAIARLEAAWKSGKLGQVRTPYWRDGWFGRGLIQITHKENYQKFGIVKSPEKALEWDTSLKILFDGMVRGMFAKNHTLERYFNLGAEDPRGARRIINGTDQAGLIADYYVNFLGALNASVAQEPPKDAEEIQTEPLSLFKDPQALIGTGGGLVATVIAAVNSPWGLASLGLVVAAGMLLAFLYLRKKEKFTEGV
jgi:hypothetical protein